MKSVESEGVESDGVCAFYLRENENLHFLSTESETSTSQLSNAVSDVPIPSLDFILK